MPENSTTSSRDVTVSDPPDIPVLVYDGDCGFCRRSIARLRKIIGDRVQLRASQELDGDFTEIPESDYENAVQFVDTDGRTASAAKAIFETLRYSWLRGLPLGLYRNRAFAALSEFAYRAVARNRSHLSRISWFFLGTHHGPSQYQLSRWLFIRGLAVIYAIAFLSLWGQIQGLVGSNGILPAAAIADELGHHNLLEALKRWPSLYVLYPSDAMLNILCGAGTLLAAVLAFGGYLPGLSLLLLWALYLSLAHAGQIFLGYQWDILLLEAGFLAIFLAPFQARLSRSGRRPPSRIAIFLIHWLIFRLMFRSGLVKLASNDDVWWDLTALGYHYWTQPLPSWTAWHVHQLPTWFHTSSVFIVFVIELAIPFLFFAPRRLRWFGALATIFLMLVIQATGNYTFFNALTIVLCIPLLDDSFWPAAWRSVPAFAIQPRRGLKEGLIRIRAAALPLSVAICWLIMTFPGTWQTTHRTYNIWKTRRAETLPTEDRERVLAALRTPQPLPPRTENWLRYVGHYRTIGHYGLFANMTESRPEILIEGSRDGRRWYAYEFRWKPSHAQRRPRVVAPHQPRLDWQMWFAALRNPRQVGWFPHFLKALLENRPEVLALLKDNPFPDAPPRFVRARLLDYSFTDRETRQTYHTWWNIKDQGLYVPIPRISLENFSAPTP